MKTTLRIAAGVCLFVSSFLSAQNVIQKPALVPVSTLTSTISAGPQSSGVEPAQEAQMVNCSDKVTYVDRHTQTNIDGYLGGSTGWQIYIQKYPDFDGQVTAIYASLRRTGTNCPVRLVLYALDGSGNPTGGYLAYVDASVNSTTATEYGGNLNTSPTVTNGFAVGVMVNSTNPNDSAMLMVHTDPEIRGYSYGYNNVGLFNFQNDFQNEVDLIIRPKIQYTAPTNTAVGSVMIECVGTQIPFYMYSANYPSFYNEPWTTTNPSTYSWNFGDAGTSTLGNPTHAYSAAGTYTVTGIETFGGWTTSCVSAPATTQSVIAGSTPSVSISASATTVCPNQAVNFSATPVNGGSSPTYVWKKNNIQVGTTNVYAGSTWAYGDVVICEMVSNASCAPTSAVVSNQVVMITQPLAVSSYNYTATGLSVSFTSTAANAVTWAWNFGDAGTSASATPVHNYAIAGTYTVDLSVTNSCGITTVSSINITVSTSGNSNGGNTGVNEKELELSVNTFPNPVNNELNIQYSLNHPTDATIEILNTLGQVVSSALLPNASTGTAFISTEGLSSGIYFVRFTAGDQVSMTKIVRQ